MRKMNIIVMTLAGLLLIIASVLKFQEMLADCIPSWQTNAALWMQNAEKAGEMIPAWKANILGFWESYEFLLIQIPLEFALGVWMVSGLFRKAAWFAGMLAYFGFIFVTLAKALLGLESCGCFGQVHVDPWITLWVVDIPFFFLLVLFWPKDRKLLPPPWPNKFYLLTVFVLTIGLMVLAAPMMVMFRPDCLKPEDQQPDASAQLKLQIFQLNQQIQKQAQETTALRQEYQNQQQTIEQQKQQIQSLRRQLQQVQAQTEQIPEPNIVEPIIIQNPDEQQQTESIAAITEPNAQSVLGSQWDWLQYVVEDDVREQLTSGLVVILMYHHDCPDCAVMVPKYSDYYRDILDQGNDAFKIAFLAIPPYSEEGPVPEDTQCILGKLTDEQNWELTSPYVIVLLEGELIKTWPQGTAPEPENLLDEIFAPAE